VRIAEFIRRSGIHESHSLTLSVYTRDSINGVYIRPLTVDCISNDIQLAHCPLICGLFHLVQ